MSYIKRYYENLVERLEKAFPELSHENIATTITMANSMEEAMHIFMEDAESVDEADTLCYDDFLCMYFFGNAKKIKERMRNLSLQVEAGMTVKFQEVVTDVYRIPLNDRIIYRDFGWNKQETTRRPVPTYDAKLTKNGVPCLVISWDSHSKPVIIKLETFARL